ncbi:MAG: PEP-CTERM sorting domain-containing protein [Rubrivivax sp.]
MKPLATALLAAFAISPVYAANTVIDFETVTSFASIAEFYNGGSDSEGNSGSNFGVSFGGDVLGLANDEYSTFFTNAPSPVGVMTAVGSDATMNVAAGFVDALSFAYSSAAFTLQAVNVWSGLNGTGALLASFNLAANAQAGGCSDSAFCRFDTLSSTFAGVAHSVTFGNAAGVAAFDNIAITAVPEPTAALMLAMGLAGLALKRRMRG